MALAGLLVATVGAGWALALDGATYALGAVFVGMLRLPPVSSERASNGDFPTRQAYRVQPSDQMSTFVSIVLPVLTSKSSGAR